MSKIACHSPSFPLADDAKVGIKKSPESILLSGYQFGDLGYLFRDFPQFQPIASSKKAATEHCFW
jgi:hypothetical protein